MRFSLINWVSLQKPTLSIDEVNFSLVNLVYLRKPILSARADKMGLSGNNLYLSALMVFHGNWEGELDPRVSNDFQAQFQLV